MENWSVCGQGNPCTITKIMWNLQIDSAPYVNRTVSKSGQKQYGENYIYWKQKDILKLVKFQYSSTEISIFLLFLSSPSRLPNEVLFIPSTAISLVQTFPEELLSFTALKRRHSLIQSSSIYFNIQIWNRHVTYSNHSASLSLIFTKDIRNLWYLHFG